MSVRATLHQLLSDWPLLLAVGMSIVAAALRIAPLSESLWLDELHTAWCALGPLDEVARRAAIGNQGPLYFWLEWLMVGLFGPSELSLRLLSLISGSLLPLAVFLLARRWTFVAAGVVAAGLLAVDPWSIFCATEARPYALLQFLAVVHVAITAELIAGTTTRLRLAWIILGAVMFYIHYTSALIVVAEVIFLLLWRITHGPIAGVGQALLDIAIVGLLCLPEVGELRAIFAHRTNWAAFIDRQPLWNAINWFTLPAWSWIALTAVAVIALALTLSKIRLKELLNRPLLLLVCCWLLLPIGLAWTATSSDVARVFFPRYLVGVLPAAALLAGLCSNSIPWRPAALLVGTATVLCGAWYGGGIDSRGENWRGCVAWLNERLPDDGFPVLLYSGLIEADELRQPHAELLEDYCLAPVTSLYPLDIDRGDLFPLPLHEPERLDQVAEMVVVHRGGAWLVVRGSDKSGASIAKAIIRHLSVADVDESAWQVAHSQSFGKVQVLLLKGGAQSDHQPMSPAVAAP